jgi:hypothetical protein
MRERERVFVLNAKAYNSNFLAREHRVLIIILTEPTRSISNRYISIV